MVVLYTESSVCVHMETEAFGTVSRDTLGYMDREVVLLDGVYDVDLFSALRKDVSCITYLSSHFGIERSALEHELVHCLVLSLYSAVAGKLYVFEVCIVISEELDIVAMCELHPVA